MRTIPKSSLIFFNAIKSSKVFQFSSAFNDSPANSRPHRDAVFNELISNFIFDEVFVSFFAIESNLMISFTFPFGSRSRFFATGPFILYDFQFV
jgi:hypothetical protein